ISFSGMSYGALLPIFAKDVFHSDAGAFALFAASTGLGSLAASGFLATQRTMRHKGKRLFLGALVFSLSVLGFSFAPSIYVGCAILVIAGGSQLTMLITANTLIQT